MDYFKQNRVLLAIILVLLLLNLATIAFILIGPMPPGPPPGPGGKDYVQELIEKELSLTAEQKAAYARLREEHFARGDSLMQSRSDAMQAVFGLLNKENVTDEELRRKAAALGENEVTRAVSTYKHFRAIWNFCTPEQRKKFGGIVNEVLMKAREPQGPPRPGR